MFREEDILVSLTSQTCNFTKCFCSLKKGIKVKINNMPQKIADENLTISQWIVTDIKYDQSRKLDLNNSCKQLDPQSINNN